jgi:putative ABC transport system substrate-binding protein
MMGGIFAFLILIFWCGSGEAASRGVPVQEEVGKRERAVKRGSPIPLEEKRSDRLPRKFLSIGLMSPQLRNPEHQTLFSGIEQGIKEALPNSPLKKYLEGSADPSSLRQWLDKERIDVLITLGKKPFDTAQQAKVTTPVVVGALNLSPKSVPAGFHGISLYPDPEKVFAWLKELAPSVRRVVIVYHPEDDGWVVEERAQEAAARHGLQLDTPKVESLTDTARNLLEGMSSSAALWLLREVPHSQNGKSEDENNSKKDEILRHILEAAWDKRIIVFSSKLEHAGRGALFSLYPDPVGMGRSLARMALKAGSSVNHKTSEVLPLEDLDIAVNLVTASHLNLPLSSQQRQRFDVTFP